MKLNLKLTLRSFWGDCAVSAVNRLWNKDCLIAYPGSVQLALCDINQLVM